MQSSLSRGHTSGITVVLSGRGFLSSYLTRDLTVRRDPKGSQSAKNAHDGGLLNAPVKLQLVNHKHGGYSIRIVHNDDRPRSQPIINENLEEISVVNHTAQQFEFLLNRDGSRHLMLFNNAGEGQQFQLILGAVNAQGQIRMTSKRGGAPMAARFPGLQGSSDVGGGGATTKKKVSSKENDRVTKFTPTENGTDDIDIHTMVELLKTSIQAGDVMNSEIWAKNLAALQPKLSILVETAGNAVSSSSDISIQVQVEDRDSSKLKLRMSVPSNITIAGLKKMTCLTYDLPTQIQNWLIGGRIAKDTETLSANGITSSGATLYLYLTSATKVNVTKESLEIEKHAFSEDQRKHQRIRPEQKPQTMRRTSGASAEDRSTLRSSHSRPRSPPPVESASIQRLVPPSHSFMERRSSSGPRNSPDERPEVKKEKTAMEVGWVCPRCTLVNPPLIPGCQACSTARPENYKVPSKGTYTMDPSESSFQKALEVNEQALLEMEQERVIQNYQDLLRIDEQDLVPNQDEFECPVCLVDCDPGEGVMLRECLHVFCRECIIQHIKQSTDALVKCPGMEDDIPCTQHVLEREIKALLSEEDFLKYLDRGLRRAESSASDSFHCKTTDCRGFCFYDDDHNFFNCPLCKKINCLTCKAIHEGIDCKQYQEDLKTRAQNDVTARQTQQALEELVKSGEAMKCPMCSIIVQKKGGCDWLRCSVCQMEICWVTKQARWGPDGTGDITGGCRCRVNGQKCHPECHNCH